MILWRYIKAIVKGFFDFFKDGGLLLAGALSYFSVMALIPFCLLLVTIFGYFLGWDDGILKFFSSRFVNFFPKVTYETVNDLKRVISYKGVGQFTVVLYMFLSYQIFSSMEVAVNTIFKIKDKRPFILSLILSLIIITLIIVFIFVSFMATSAIQMLKELRDYFPDIRIGTITGFLIRYVVPLTLMFFTTAAVYIILPKKKVRLRNALFGALFTAVFLEAAKHIFTIYVLKVTRLGAIYGPLSAFIIFLLWVFYSSCIFLMGAEVVHNMEGNR